MEIYCPSLTYKYSIDYTLLKKLLNILGIVSIAMTASIIMIHPILSQTTPEHISQEEINNITNIINLPNNQTEGESRFILLLDCPVNITRVPDDCFVFPLSKNIP